MIKKFFAIVFIIIAIILLKYSFFTTESGYIYHYQDMLMGKIDVYDEPGIHFKIPFSFRVTRYAQVWTVNFGSPYGGIQVRQKGAITLRFADTYTAKIPATFRYKLPRNKETVKMIHRDFREFQELIDSLLIKTARDVVVNTATQYTGEEFFLGGFNQFKAALDDQLRNGIYKTERKQVEIEQMTLAPIGLEQEDSTQLQKAKTLLWKTVPIIGSDGKMVRLENPLDAYGIEVVYIALGEPVPETQLDQLLADKKRLVAERIKTVQEQETAKELAKTVQLRAEIDRTKAKQEALKEKEMAVIAKQREVEVAQKEKEKEIIDYEKIKALAVIDKAKDLAIAEAERDIEKVNKEKELIMAQAEQEIQKAHFEAAQFEAKAIREKGIAEAEVLEAKYNAMVPDIYIAEIQRDIANIIYPNLKGIQVTMPRNIVNLGEQADKLQTNLDVLSSFAAIGVMEGLEKKALEGEQSVE
jgi:hypothetical protein